MILSEKDLAAIRAKAEKCTDQYRATRCYQCTTILTLLAHAKLTADLSAVFERERNEMAGERDRLAETATRLQQDAERGEGLKGLSSCCVQCGTAPAVNAEPVNDIICVRLSPRCNCHSDFHFWPRAARASTGTPETK